MNFLEHLFMDWRMVQWLSAGPALAEDWTLVPSTTYVRCLTTPSNSSSVEMQSFWLHLRSCIHIPKHTYS